MRALGLDLGTKTLGLALSDANMIIASTYKTIRFDEGMEESTIPELKKIIDEFEVGTLVLGLPKNMNNTIGPRGEACLAFQKKLEDELKIKVEMQDERLSTVAAHNYMLEADMSRKKRKEKVDTLAASIILQSYLDKKKGR